MDAGQRIVEDLLREVSNWGRWGDDDDRGTLNLLTDAGARAALKTVRAGSTIPLGRSLGPRATMPGEAPVQHHMLATGSECPAEGEHVMADWFGLQPHGLSITHLDALNHMAWNGRLYNGAPASAVTALRGGAYGSAEHVSRGVVTRGILLDVPRALGHDWIDPARPIGAGHLDACLAYAGAEVRPGDAVLIRTGRDPWLAGPGGGSRGVGDGLRLAGLDVDCLPWLHERDVAIMASDAVHDVVPGLLEGVGSPVHVVALVGMGLWLLDNLTLEELARRCEGLARWEFAFMMAPIALKNATGAPVNPLAVL